MSYVYICTETTEHQTSKNVTGPCLADNWQSNLRDDRGCRDNDNIIRKRVLWELHRFHWCFYCLLSLSQISRHLSTKPVDHERPVHYFREIKKYIQWHAARRRGSWTSESKWYRSHIHSIMTVVLSKVIISPALFIISLDQLIQLSIDMTDSDIKVGNTNEIRVSDYDYEATLGTSVEEMTVQQTRFADESLRQADMRVKLKKTFTKTSRIQEVVNEVTVIDQDQDIHLLKKWKWVFKCKFTNVGCTQHKNKNSKLVKSWRSLERTVGTSYTSSLLYTPGTHVRHTLYRIVNTKKGVALVWRGFILYW